jgi:RHS repeat-associated protein
VLNNNAVGQSSLRPIGDINGQGVSAVALGLQSAPGYNVVATSTYAPDLITGFNSGLGATTGVVYSPLDRAHTLANPAGVYTKGTGASYPTQDIENATYVVQQVQADNGIGGTYNTDYNYAGGQADVQGRGFLGFSTVNANDDQTGIVTSTSYFNNQLIPNTSTPYGLGWPFTGYATEVKQTYYASLTSSVVLLDTLNTYKAVSLGGTASSTAQFIELTKATSVDSSGNSLNHELNGDSLPAATTQYTYDGNGNVSQLTLTTTDGYSSTTGDTYLAPTSCAYILDRLSLHVVTNKAPFTNSDGTITTNSVIHTTNYTEDACTGVRTQEIDESGSTSLQVETDYTPDSFGNITQTKIIAAGVSPNRITSATYDGNGQFPNSTTNASGYTSYPLFDPRYGGMTSVTDPYGLTTSWTYDGFARKTAQTRPDGTQTKWIYAQAAGCGFGACNVLQQTTGAPDVTKIYDKLGRPTQVQSPGFDGTMIIAEATVFDALGRVSTVARPYFSGGTQYLTLYDGYDALKRVTHQTFPDNSAANPHTLTIQYAAPSGEPLTTTIATGTLSNPSRVLTSSTTETATTEKNSQGEVIQVTDDANSATSYQYDPFGNMLQVKDALGNIVSMTYDIRGHMIGMIDPDKGGSAHPWSYVPDALGEVTSQTDGNGVQTTFQYDAEGRVKQHQDPTVTRSFTYDTQPFGFGQLATATAGGYARTEYYDGSGRPAMTKLVEDTVTHYAGTTYDGSGRVATKTYPSGTSVTYAYTGNGYLSSVSGDQGVIWTANQRDAELHLLTETFGNNVVVSNQGFDASTGRIKTIQTGTSGSIVNLAYSWDQMGNLYQRNDTVTGVNETLGYNTLNWLRSSVGAGSMVVTYDRIGNITYKSDLTFAGGTGNYCYYSPTATTPCYSNAPAVGPHAVQSISGTVSNGTGSGFSNPTYKYDYNGNMTLGGGRTATYTTANMTATVIPTGGTDTISYEYDATDQRYRQTATVNNTNPAVIDNDTLYWTGQGVTSEYYTAGSAAAVWKNYIVADGKTVAVTQGSNVGGSTWGTDAWGTMTWSAPNLPVTYMHEDHLGSVVTVTKSDGTVLERDTYDPWGKRRNNGAADNLDTMSSSQVNRGYTDQEYVNSVAWLNLNARMYDPQIGRFMSADPVTGKPYSTQGWNRYAYVENNPLNQTDPTGEIDCPQGVKCDEVIVTAPAKPKGAAFTVDDGITFVGVSFGGTGGFFAGSVTGNFGATAGSGNQAQPAGKTGNNNQAKVIKWKKTPQNARRFNRTIQAVNKYAVEHGYAPLDEDADTLIFSAPEASPTQSADSGAQGGASGFQGASYQTAIAGAVAIPAPAGGGGGTLAELIAGNPELAPILVAAYILLHDSVAEPRIFRHYGYAADAPKFAGGLYPGSFATTANGPPLTGEQAQRLLALPPRASVPDSYYTVTVGPNTPVLGPSTVQPAYGQPGGGIEYTFPEGTVRGSVTGPTPIPRY